MNLFVKTYYLVHHMGLRWLLFRFWYVVQIRFGLLEKRMRVTSWYEAQISEFLKSGEQLEKMVERILNSRLAQHLESLVENHEQLKRFRYDDVIDKADAIYDGKFDYFSAHEFEMGFPPAWFLNPFDQTTYPSDVHWSRINDFESGDIKCVWELNRFAFVYTLVRAYARSGDDRYVRVYWELIEDWAEKNPLNKGVNWKCGQEVSFRLMAWIFGLLAFIHHYESTVERVGLLLQLLACSGDRIEKNIQYAVSQNNNHGISEAMALWTLGCLFPEFKYSDRWQKKGLRLLEKQALKLIDTDGGFSQHSAVYHRVILQNFLWIIWLAGFSGLTLPKTMIDAISRAHRLAYQLMEPFSGELPCFGNSDGSDILPLTSCSYKDFRPALQALAYGMHQKRWFECGPWDELLYWCYGTEPISGINDVPDRKPVFAVSAGIYTRISDNSDLFMHCPLRFEHRPAHADLMHVSIRYGGKPIAIDAGTYSYNAPDPWNNLLSETAYHNTVTVDDQNQMTRIGKFLWMPWPKSRIYPIRKSTQNLIHTFSGIHAGYYRLKDPVTHRRMIVQLPEDVWIVLDDLKCRHKHEARLQWLFEDYDHRWNGSKLHLKTAEFSYFCYCNSWDNTGKMSLVRADANSPRGWKSHAYLKKTPALSWACEQHRRRIHFLSVFDPEEGVVQHTDDYQFIYERHAWALSLMKNADHKLYIQLTGKYQDQLEVDACIAF